ncbi:MAG: hypothetical protein ONB05_10740, partial [candidate division KSB1 bacterium]|nr:hypothetical protein [candidate division KSB1 bacterium]
MKVKISILAIVVLGLIAISATLQAQVPRLINYQGLLTHPTTGAALSGTYSIQFSIYNVAAGGSALWSETQSVTVTDGLFNVLLGTTSLIPYTVFDGNDKYLGVKVGTDPEMTPRKRLVSVGYAFRAYEADKLDGQDAATF